MEPDFHQVHSLAQVVCKRLAHPTVQAKLVESLAFVEVSRFYVQVFDNEITHLIVDALRSNALRNLKHFVLPLAVQVATPLFLVFLFGLVLSLVKLAKSLQVKNFLNQELTFLIPYDQSDVIRIHIDGRRSSIDMWNIFRKVFFINDQCDEIFA